MQTPQEATAGNRLHRAASRLPEMVGLLRELVEIESPSDDPAGVSRLASRLEREFEGLGLPSERLAVEGAGPLLVAHEETRPGVLLLGHLDTVWPMGTLARRPVVVSGERLLGPGSFDMKGGLVVIVHALRLLREEGVLPPVTVFLTPLEEVGADSYRARMEAAMRRSTAVLCFEPAWPGGAVKTERKGTASFVLRARGVAAHAGADFSRGRNAILTLARAVLRASDLTDLARGISVNVGVIRGGIRPNVIPDSAEAQVDIRYRTATDGQEVLSAFRALASEDLDVVGGLGYPPLERGAGVQRLYTLARNISSSFGIDLPEASTGGASEASFAAALGIPTLDGLGPDGDGAHAESEHVLLASLPGRVALAAGLVSALSA